MKKAISLISIGLLMALFMATVPIHAIAMLDNDARLLWNDKEAFIFIGRTDLGWSFNAFQWVYEVIAGAAGTTSGHDQKRSSLVVIKWRPNRTELHTISGGVEGPIAALDDEIYLLGGKWANDHIEALTDQDNIRLTAARNEKKTAWPVEGRNVTTALLRQNVAERRFPMQIANETVTLIVRSSNPPHVERSMTIERDGGAPETLWSLDERTRWVSTADYRRFFGGADR